MLKVFRHYLPARRALLFFSETVLLTVVLGLGMSAHLFQPGLGVIGRISEESLSPDEALRRCLISAFFLSVLSQIAIGFNELYDFRVSNSRFDRAARFVASTGSAIAVALGAVVLAKAWHLERVFDFPGMTSSQLVQTLVFTMLLGFTLLYFWRNVFHFALHRWNFNERVLILGAGKAAHSLAKEMLERTDSGFEAVGLLPESVAEGGDTPPDRRSGGGSARSVAPAAASASRAIEAGEAGGGAEVAPATSATAALLLDPIPLPTPAHPEPSAGGNGNGNGHGTAEAAEDAFFRLVKALKVDVVVVALDDRRRHLPTEALLRCRLAGVSVQEREALYEHITGKIAVEAMRPSYLIFNEGFGSSLPAEIAKRTLDIVLSTIGLLLTWPLMILTAIAVRLDSPGPILFTQERVGRDGVSFTLYKFRSMRSDAETATGPVWATEDDPRITRVGRFLRKSRLDELPQLFNVLAGDMSLVGPRPERPVFVEDLAKKIPYYNQRHIVKPGVTGWAQNNYRYGSTIEDALQKLQYDLFYIKNMSLLFDLSILFTTIKTVVLRKGT